MKPPDENPPVVGEAMNDNGLRDELRRLREDLALVRQESAERARELAELRGDASPEVVRMDAGERPELQVVRGARVPWLATHRDFALHRETTAKWLGLGIFFAFGFGVFTTCLSHAVSLYMMAEPPPPNLAGEALDAWFRWREQLSATVTSFCQTIGTLLSGPLGVVLGFYFRDRHS